MFNVVVAKDWCSVVPQCWVINDKKICFWPPNNNDVTKAVKKQLNPDDSWKSTKIKYILGPYGKNNF